MSKAKNPRGIRNNNPGNIRWGAPWQGLRAKPDRDDTAFCQFQNAVFGIRALARTLITYQDKHGLRTIRQIITRWAPPTENNTLAYIHVVARQTGFEIDQELDLHGCEHLRPVLEAIIRHENGKGARATANTWYDDETISKGLAIAGVVAPTPTVSSIPVTRETVAATATGGAGVAQIADVLASVPVETLAQANEHLSNGSTLRLAIGVLMIAVAVFIAWSQVKRHQDGTL